MRDFPPNGFRRSRRHRTVAAARPHSALARLAVGLLVAACGSPGPTSPPIASPPVMTPAVATPAIWPPGASGTPRPSSVASAQPSVRATASERPRLGPGQVIVAVVGATGTGFVAVDESSGLTPLPAVSERLRSLAAGADGRLVAETTGGQVLAADTAGASDGRWVTLPIATDPSAPPGLAPAGRGSGLIRAIPTDRRTRLTWLDVDGKPTTTETVPAAAEGPPLELPDGRVLLVVRDTRDRATLALMSASGALEQLGVPAYAVAAGGPTVVVQDTSSTLRVGDLTDLVEGRPPATNLFGPDGATPQAYAVSSDGSRVAVAWSDVTGAVTLVTIIARDGTVWTERARFVLPGGSDTAWVAWTR